MPAVTHGIGTASTANASTYASAPFTPAAGDLLIVFAIVTASVQNPGILTNSAGITFTKVTSFVKAGSADTLYCFVANALAAAVSQTCTMDVTGDAGTGCIIFVARIAGMTKTGNAAIKQSNGQSNQTAAGTPAPTFTSNCATNNPTLGFIANATNPAGMTPPPNWTEATPDLGYNTPTTGAEYVFRDSGFTATVITWGNASATAFGDIIIELDGARIQTALPIAAAFSSLPQKTLNIVTKIAAAAFSILRNQQCPTSL